MRVRHRGPAYALCALALVLWLAVMFAALLAGCSASGPKVESAWPESAEFSQLETGQERFSVNATNIGSCFVIVDHETGIQYLLYGEGYHSGYAGWSYTGLCPLLDADGTPLLVAEAGE